jgi:hypothetical protein
MAPTTKMRRSSLTGTWSFGEGASGGNPRARLLGLEAFMARFFSIVVIGTAALTFVAAQGPPNQGKIGMMGRGVGMMGLMEDRCTNPFSLLLLCLKCNRN